MIQCQNIMSELFSFLTFADICNSVEYCFHHTKPKVSIIKAYLNREQFAYRIWSELANGTYQFRKPKDIIIHEKKDRVIQSPLFADRVVQIAMLKKGLYQLLTHPCLPCNCSCQVGKGPVYTNHLLLKYLRSHFARWKLSGYVVYLDIHDFYNSVDHAIIFDALKRIPIEYRSLLYQLISVNNPEHHGLSLGSPTSALLANFLLSKLDHYVKDQLGIKHYLRYCDDMIAIVPDEESAKRLFCAIIVFLKQMKFEINSKSHISKFADDITFLGVRYRLTKSGRVMMRLTPSNVNRMKRRIRKLKKNHISNEDIKNCLYSWTSHALVTKNTSIVYRMWAYAGFVYDKDLDSQIKKLDINRDYSRRLYSRYLKGSTVVI